MKMPESKKLIKVMCNHQDERNVERFASSAVRFEEVAKDTKVLRSGWLQSYFQVQIDHSAN